ncbi:MAG: RloB family protein [Bacteroidales bacterium]|nr:RloB family protein [Bacteroidales bacterium]
MGKRKSWNNYRPGRNTGKRGPPKERILIVCEGEKTEPNYFLSFKVTSASVIVVGTGKNTNKVVEKALEKKIKEEEENTPYDQIWCVFDRDSFPDCDFNSALKLAKTNNIKVAYSNEAFELWYLLHFEYWIASISRKAYKNKLTKRLGKEYKKNSKTMYDDLLDKQPQAIFHAKKLIKSYLNHNPLKDNPCTKVFELVEELNKNL